jgi:2',3'-cyclic-nucleotide 2'-phosphodiesterase / 3'-nucleotidase
MSGLDRLRLDRRAFLLGTSALGATSMLHPFSAFAAAGQAHLRLLETTDIHVNVLPYDYYADAPNDTMGLSRTAAIIAAIRAEATNSLLLENGDYLQGSPMGDYIAYERGMKAGDLHPVIKGMNVLGYTAGTLGNHEFNYGLDFMDKVNAGTNYPLVCANLIRGTILASNPRNDTLYLKPYTIVEKTIKDGDGNAYPIRIGIIGFLPPQIMIWDSSNLTGKVITRDIVEAAAAWVPEIREQGVDLVVALSHSGINPNRESGMENASLFVAGVPGIDVIYTGHSHLVFPGPTYANLPGVDNLKGTLMGKPAVMAGFWGSHMGLIDLLLQRDGKTWKLASFEVEARPIVTRQNNQNVPTVKDAKEVVDAVKADHDATLVYVRRPVGKTAAPLFSYFALVKDDPSVQIVNQAQSWYTKQMLHGTEWEKLPILSAAAPFKAGGLPGPDYYTDVPAGDVAIKNVADLYLFPNTTRAVLINGAQVKEWLEMSAGIFNQLQPGKADQPLINDRFPSYNFDVIDGVSYQYDLTQPQRYDGGGKLINPDAHRVVNLTFAGKPIDPAQKFVVATNNYRAGGGGNFPDINDKVTIFVGPDTNRDVIVRYIVDQGTFNPSADGNWSFVPIAGATAMFQSGPKAKAHLGDVNGVEYVNDDKSGFANFRLKLS